MVAARGMAHAAAMTEQTLDVDAAEPSPDAGRPLPPPTGEPAGRPRWFRVPVSRDKEAGKVGGVIAGVARAYGFDLRTTRIAVAIATVVMPVLAAVYLVAWVLLPASPTEAAPLQDLARDRRRLPLYVAIALVLVVGGLGSFGSWHLFGGIPWGLGLIAVGILLWVAGGPAHPTGSGPSSTTTAPPPPPGSPSTSPVTPAVTPTGTVGTALTAGTLAPPPPGSSRPTASSTPKRKRYPIGRLSALATVAFLIVAQLGDTIDAWDITVLAATVTALFILAIGAIAAIVVNRVWYPVPTLLVTASVATFLLVTTPPFEGGVGDRTDRPTTVEQAQTEHRLALGQLTIDLTAVPLAGSEHPSTVTVVAQVGAGRLLVIVPDDVALRLDLDLGAGHVVVDGDELADGVHQQVVRSIDPAGPARATIVLDAEVGMGELAIEHRSAG